MRSIILVFLLSLCQAALSFGQAVRVGVVGGVPITSRLSRYSFLRDESRPYLIGPSIEVKLPGNFAVEADAIYRRLGGSSFFQFSGNEMFPGGAVWFRQRANSWELPVFGKYYFKLPTRKVQPFLGTGYALQNSWFSSRSVSILGSAAGPSIFSATNRTGLDIGVLAVAGARVNAGRLSFSPQFRYTRWSAPGNQFGKNQVDFVFGVHF